MPRLAVSRDGFASRKWGLASGLNGPLQPRGTPRAEGSQVANPSVHHRVEEFLESVDHRPKRNCDCVLRRLGAAQQQGRRSMTTEQFKASIDRDEPFPGLSVSLTALWWDATGNWERAHELVNELETRHGMAVHAYLHRKAGDRSNADYWYQRAGRSFERATLDAEWLALVEGLLSAA